MLLHTSIVPEFVVMAHLEAKMMVEEYNNI